MADALPEVTPVLQNIPPKDMKPGFVAPTVPSPAVNAEPTPSAEPKTDGLGAAIEALTKALASANPAAAVTTGAAATVEDPKLPTDLNNFDVESLQDPILKSMATVMQTVGKGLDMDRALGKAIEYGNIEFIDQAYIKEAGGAASEDLLTIARGLVQAVAAKSEAVTQGIYTLAGGEQNWNVSVTAFNTGAEKELRLVVSQMLNSGREDLIQAGAKMVVEYSRNSGLIPRTGTTVTAGAGAPAGQALDAASFQKALVKLDPYSPTYMQDRSALFDRRNLGRSLGL